MPKRKKDGPMTIEEIRRWMKRPTAMAEIEASIEANVMAFYNRIHFAFDCGVTTIHTKH